jgi:hypothetical protein
MACFLKSAKELARNTLRHLHDSAKIKADLPIVHIRALEILRKPHISKHELIGMLQIIGLTESS